MIVNPERFNPQVEINPKKIYSMYGVAKDIFCWKGGDRKQLKKHIEGTKLPQLKHKIKYGKKGGPRYYIKGKDLIEFVKEIQSMA